MNEAADAAGGCRGEHRESSGDVTLLEAFGVRRVDNARDVDDGVSFLHKLLECFAVFEVAAEPNEIPARLLHAASEGGNFVASRQRRVDDVRSDETRAAGDREFHRGDQGRSVPASSKRSSASVPRRWMIVSRSGSRPSSSGAETAKMGTPPATF